MYSILLHVLFSISYRLRLPCLDIADRYRHIIIMYVKDLEFIQRTYNKNKENPPIPRDLPPIAGKIAWIRQLYRHISSPIQVFQQFSELMKCNEARKAIKGYNKMARVLVEYEVLHHQAWVKQVCIVKSLYMCRDVIIYQVLNTIYFFIIVLLLALFIG